MGESQGREEGGVDSVSGTSLAHIVLNKRIPRPSSLEPH